ncbi:hypothetical protein ACJMK2_030291 [Sinanodonta woodiana]|uniref:Mitochondrial import inner membrane translocase subunit n=1 Tax=Sinanodonta woodiana TaxID=1069815 RepID=A0ABD3XCS9_SINWO
MDFGSSSPSSAGMDSHQRDNIMGQVKQQVAVMQVQQLLESMTDKCFKKCVTSPGSSLGSAEQKCLAMCMDRYLDCMNVVTQAYSSRLQKEMS